MAKKKTTKLSNQKPDVSDQIKADWKNKSAPQYQPSKYTGLRADISAEIKKKWDDGKEGATGRADQFETTNQSIAAQQDYSKIQNEITGFINEALTNSGSNYGPPPPPVIGSTVIAQEPTIPPPYTRIPGAGVPVITPSADPPFNVTTETDSGTLYFKVLPGYIAGIAPTMDDPSLGVTPIDDDPPPRMALTGSGTEIVFLKLNATLTSANDFVYRETFSTVIIDVAGALPTDDLAAGEYYLRLATLVDGVKQTPQPVLTNQTYYIYDTLLGVSEANCQFAAA